MSKSIKLWIIECDGLWYLKHARPTRSGALESASQVKWLPGSAYKAVRVVMRELPKKKRSNK